MRQSKAKKSKPLGTDYWCKCGNSGEEWHTCARKVELYEDYEKCNCCSECTAECAEEV
jgi:hypothetical protein